MMADKGGEFGGYTKANVPPKISIMACVKVEKREVKMRDRLHLGALSCYIAGGMLALATTFSSQPWVIGLTCGAGACFVAAGIVMTIMVWRG